MALSTIRGLVFDAYGTLFDVRAVGESCAGIAPDPAAFVAIWRAKQLEYAFLRALMRRYADFWDVTRDALRFAAATSGVTLAPGQEETLMEAWYRVAPFPEVEQTLAELSRRGLRLAVLSNGSSYMLERLVQATGLERYFEGLLSVDEIHTYKPDPSVYTLAERKLGLPRESLLFVSSNFWDVAGAHSFGLRVCWINRTGAQPDELGVQPDHILESMTALPELVQKGEYGPVS